MHDKGLFNGRTKATICYYSTSGRIQKPCQFAGFGTRLIFELSMMEVLPGLQKEKCHGDYILVNQFIQFVVGANQPGSGNTKGERYEKSEEYQ